MTIVPEILPNRLRLRGYEASDFDQVHTMWSDPKVVAHINGHPATEAESWSRLMRYAGHWSLLGFGYGVVEDRTTGAFLGEVGQAIHRRGFDLDFDMAPEAGWVLAPAAWGRGVGREAVATALSWADRTLLAAKTMCLIAGGDAASRRLAAVVCYREIRSATCGGRPVGIFHRYRQLRHL